MTNKKTYLFLFSIGPVQSFIAQARKTQDLYAGSKILSELAKEGLRAAKPKEYIFPNSTSNESVPNRFLCLIDNDDPKQLGIDVEQAVQTKWNEIAKPILDFTNINGIRQQIESHLDINWAFVEIPSDTEGGYKAAYEKIERLLGAVKNARSFYQFNYQLDNNGDITLGEKGRKCSLDGERNVKFYRRTENEQDAKDGKRRNENDISVYENKLFSNKKEVKVIDNDDETQPFIYSKLQAGEGLSAVSMAKRLYESETFRSTADIAMLCSIRYLFSFERIKQTCAYRKHFDSYFKFSTPFNAQLYFEENLTENYFKKQGYRLLTDKLNEIKADRKALEKEAKEAKYPFLKYYAIIDFDGDSMGKWLSGENINDPQNKLKEFHQALSSGLAAFATKARAIVNNNGQTVYAGGDDFTGFVNLNYLFKAMQELTNEYDKIVNVPLAAYRKEGQELSFSAGVCIAHYKEPLSMVLDKAKQAQKAAKHDDKGKRKAFSIMASKHSGENHETYFKWAEKCQNVKDLETVINELKNDKRFSNTFIKVLNIEFAKLTDTNGRLCVSRRALLNDEVTRLLKRSFMGNKDDKKTESLNFAKVIMDIYDHADTFNNFINALNICDFIHRLIATGDEMGQLPKTEEQLCATL